MARLGAPGVVATPDAEAPVTMLELFFDLVFVFTVTQVTSLLGDATTARGYAEGAALLYVIWWMYDGYAFLSNNVGPTTTSTRIPMLAAMAGFLVMAITVPTALGSDALLFAAAYLFIVVVHLLSFLRSTLGGSARAILGIAPVNFGGAALLFVAAALPVEWRWVCWWAAVAVSVSAMVFRRERGFAIRPGHFAERHRLLLIIALGESVIAVGVSAVGHASELPVLTAVLLAMTLLALLWWVHFDDDESATEQLIEVGRQDPERMMRLAMFAFSMAYLVLIAGLILLAAGLHDAVHGPGHHLSWQVAVTMALGVATYLFGNSLHLWLLGLGTGWVLKLAALLALGSAWVGHEWGGAAQTGVLVVLLLGAVLGTRRRSQELVSAAG